MVFEVQSFIWVVIGGCYFVLFPSISLRSLGVVIDGIKIWCGMMMVQLQILWFG